MNKRILELMDECGLWIDYDNREVTRRELEFFAEQIVRECVECVKEDMYSGAGCHSDFSTGGDWALETAINNIKEKFGVE